MNFQENETYDKYADLPTTRTKYMTHIASRLKLHCYSKGWNQNSPYKFLTYTNNEDDIQLHKLESKDILMIAAHGNSTWNSISNTLMMINMADLATGLIELGLNTENTPHIILLSCQAGSALVHKNEKEYMYNRYPYILILHEQLKKHGCNARITGAVCTFSSGDIQPCIQPLKTGKILIHQKDKATVSKFEKQFKKFWKFLTIENDHVMVTNELDYALKCNTPEIDKIETYGVSMTVANFKTLMCPPCPEQINTSEPVPLGSENITMRQRRRQT